ncbi:hypothetical protein [Sorangium sp. So ce1099]|uniref:hypothetical protein n=1 Tax=Sorangium sp. So ce1099 TaxID=3133331 RepID=UPI003F5E2B4B
MGFRSRLAACWLMSVAIAGCGGEAVVRDAGAGAGGQGGATAGSSSSGSIGSSSGGGFDPAASAISSASGGIVDCSVAPDEHGFEIGVIGDGPPQRLPSGCGEDPLPLLQILGGGECAYSLAARACASPAGGAAIELSARSLLEPGTSDAARVRYRAGDGVDYEAADGQLVIEALGDVGAVARGRYAATVVSEADGATALSISGEFTLCRVPDGLPCP